MQPPMYTIENDQLVISVKARGAEVDRIYSKQTALDYLWNGDPAFWNKKSPVLFPVVGALKDNTYFFNDRSYKLGRHGFARDMEFALSAKSDHSIVLTLQGNEETLSVYPFPFQLDIEYRLTSDTLVVTYYVTNTGNENMFFSIGGHPAFKLPLEESLEYDDYYLEFEHVEHARRWMVSRQGLIEPVAVPFLVNENKLPLNKELFSSDALVFKHLNSHCLHLKTDKSTHGLEFRFPRFPYLGLWAAPGADFVCLEPWCGIADSTLSDQQLINKEGIQLLTPKETFKRHWSVRCY